MKTMSGNLGIKNIYFYTITPRPTSIRVALWKSCQSDLYLVLLLQECMDIIYNNVANDLKS